MASGERIAQPARKSRRLAKITIGLLLEKLRSGATARIFGLSVANALLGLATATLLARVLGPNNFGTYSFLLAVLATASSPIGTGLRQVVLRETAYARARPDAPHPYHVWLWAYKVGALFCLACAVAGIGWGMASIGLSGRTAIIASLIVTLFAVPIMHVGVGGIQGLGFTVTSQIPEYLIRPIGLLVIFGALALVDSARPLPLEPALVVYAISTVIAAGAALLWLRGYAVRGSAELSLDRVSPRSLDTRALTWAAASFGMIQSVQFIADTVDMLMLGFLDNAIAVAHYRVATAIATLTSFGIIAVNTAIAPEVARLHAQGAREELQKLIHTSTLVISLISLAALLGILIAGHLVLVILFGSEYVAATMPLFILSAGRFVNCCFGPVALVLSLTGHERLTLAGLCASAAVNIMLCPILIPGYGAVGAALAASISMAVWGLFLWVALRRTTGFTTMLGAVGNRAARKQRRSE